MTYDYHGAQKELQLHAKWQQQQSPSSISLQALHFKLKPFQGMFQKYTQNVIYQFTELYI